MNRTYIFKNEQQLGPFDDALIMTSLNNGSFDYPDLCWREGWEEWRPLETLFPRPILQKDSVKSTAISSVIKRFVISRARWIFIVVIILLCVVKAWNDSNQAAKAINKLNQETEARSYQQRKQINQNRYDISVLKGP